MRKIKKKPRVLKINPNNMFGIKTIEDMKEYNSTMLRRIKETEDYQERMSKLNFFLWLGVGDRLYYEEFLKILDIVNIKFVDFRIFNVGSRTESNKISYEWFDKVLKNRLYEEDEL